MKKSDYYFDQRYLNAKDPWGIFCRPSQMYRLRGYLKVIDRIAPTGVASALEIACADGFFTEMLVKKAKHITATDYAPELIALARKRVQVDTVAFRVAALPDLDVSEQSFDLVTAFEVLLYFSDDKKRSSIETIGRALKGGGYFVFTEDWDAVKGCIDSAQFEMISIEQQLVHFLHLQDHVYNVARRIDFVIQFIQRYKTDDRYTQFGQTYKHKPVIRFLILFRGILYLFVPLLYVLSFLMRLFYSSRLLHGFLLALSRVTRYKTTRHTIVLKKRT